MKFLFSLAAIVLSMSASSQTSIYSIQLDSIAGSSTINFAAFQGKKILVINSASGDSTNAQYSQIKQLNTLYKDSLVVIVIPSNSFNSENGSESLMLSFYSQDANNRFPVAAKVSVKGVDIHPLYEWLTQKVKNGVMDSEVRRPFQKYLISRSGGLIGVFSAAIKPLDAPIIRAINTNSN